MTVSISRWSIRAYTRKRREEREKKKKLKEKRQIQKQLFKEQECGEEPEVVQILLGRDNRSGI